MKKIYFIILFFISFVTCNNLTQTSDQPIDEFEKDNNQNIEEPTSTTTTSSSSTTTTEFVCPPDNNTEIDFDNIKNVQIFLNKYGFNAGDEDGYLGPQTTNAIIRFQLYAGLKADGDVGQITKNKMLNWTGCEDRVESDTSNVNSDSTTTTQPQSTTTTQPQSTTTTQPQSTTTTTVVSANSEIQKNNYGIFPHISLSTNEVISLFKGVNSPNDICGTPYLNKLNPGIANQYTNGLFSQSLSILNETYTQSNLETEITEESSSQIKIKIIGDGSTDFKFYFISPFSSNLINIVPNSVSTSLNLTEAIFNLESFSSGVWFYSFAEAGNGTVVKATGNREFSVGTVSSQQVASHSGIHKLIMTSKDNSTGLFKNITSGQYFDTASKANIVYITDNILDNRLDTTEIIKIEDTVIKLSNENQAYVSEILLIGTELMKVESKDGNSFTVQRGFLNTEIKDYQIGQSVRAVKVSNKDSRISNFAYAVFRNESGMRFHIPLGPELTINEFNFNNCIYERYSLEKFVTFSWRSSGSSTLTKVITEDKLNPLFDKAFVVNSGGQSYTPPSINSSDLVSGEFLNSGPRDLVVKVGDEIKFNFNGIVDGSSKTKFIKIKFQLLPDSGSTKKSKYKEIYMTLDNEDYSFKLDIDNIVSSETSLENTWEDGYKYIFYSLTLFDTITSVEIINNSTINYDYKTELGSHDAYYLDQFSFIVRSN